jgi:hypothetical protein
MMNIFDRLEKLQQRAGRVQRQQSLEQLLSHIQNHRLSRTERTEMLGRVMADLTAGKIRPGEANKLTKAIMKTMTREDES